MSVKVFDGDEWKHAKPRIVGPTRTEEQSRINAAYALGRILREDWRERTDELSEPTKWIAAGRIQ